MALGRRSSPSRRRTSTGSALTGRALVMLALMLVIVALVITLVLWLRRESASEENIMRLPLPLPTAQLRMPGSLAVAVEQPTLER